MIKIPRLSSNLKDGANMSQLKFRNLVVAALFAALALMNTGTALAGPGTSPDHVHFAWQSDPATTFTGVWRTAASVTQSEIEVETGGVTESFSGSTYTYPDGDGIMHVAEATGLDPNTLYNIRVGDGASLWSGWEQLATAPLPTEQCEPIKFAVIGDTRSSIGDGASVWWSTVLDSCTDQDPDFIVITGDLIAEGDEQDGWDEWFEVASSDIASVPIIPTWGNHDDRGTNQLMDQFALPTNSVTGNEDFFSLRYGNALLMILDTEHGAGRYAEQGPWIDAQFAANTDAIWTFALHHRPGYSSGTTHGSEDEVQTYFVPYFDSNHLDVSFGSHDHMYERTCIINQDACVNDPADGTLYYVSGGGGAFMNPIGGFKWFTEKFNGLSMHSVIVEIEFNKMTISAVSYLENVFDTFEIVKPELGIPTASFTVAPGPYYAGTQVDFDASSSFDPCGTIASWDWDFDDGSQGTGETPFNTYSVAGFYDVTLTVTDADGETDDHVTQIEVLEVVDDDDDDNDDNDDNDDTSDDDDDTTDDDDDTVDDDDDIVDDDDDTTDDDDDTVGDDDDDDDDSGGCGK
jgi:PKD domain/Calcineurin-like phosphoesterase/Purple acid Phosphatase, N-terminal domain